MLYFYDEIHLLSYQKLKKKSSLFFLFCYNSFCPLFSKLNSTPLHLKHRNYFEKTPDGRYFEKILYLPIPL